MKTFTLIRLFDCLGDGDVPEVIINEDYLVEARLDFWNAAESSALETYAVNCPQFDDWETLGLVPPPTARKKIERDWQRALYKAGLAWSKDNGFAVKRGEPAFLPLSQIELACADGFKIVEDVDYRDEEEEEDEAKDRRQIDDHKKAQIQRLLREAEIKKRIPS